MFANSNKSSARALLELPYDISQQILNDVPLYRVLAMAASLDGTEHGKRFKDLLLCLPLQRTFFPDEEHLTYMIGLYKLYHEVLQSTIRCTKHLVHPRNSPLSMNLSGEGVLKARKLQWEEERFGQRNWLLYQLYLMLRSFGWWANEDIFPPSYPTGHYYARNRDPAIFYRYKEYWQIIKEKHFHFATKRQAQIQRLADTFRKYPTCLKKSSDPGFEARLNHTHIVTRLESCARQYRKDLLLKHYIRRECHLYRYDHLPILPLDQDLLLFVHTLTQYPYDYSYSCPENFSRSRLEVESFGIARLLISGENPPQSLIYPSHIKDEISRVNDGLSYVYMSEKTIPDSPLHQGRRRHLMKRTKFTVSLAGSESERPSLMTCEFCADTYPGTLCYNCYQALLRLPKRTRKSRNDDKPPGPPFSFMTATSIGFQDMFHVSPKPVFTVPPWPHLQSIEGYGFFKIDHQGFVQTPTPLTNSFSNSMKPVTTRNYQAGRITSRMGDQEESDEWDEREFQWLESFLYVITWMEAQGLRASIRKSFESID